MASARLTADLDGIGEYKKRHLILIFRHNPNPTHGRNEDYWLDAGSKEQKAFRGAKTPR